MSAAEEIMVTKGEENRPETSMPSEELAAQSALQEYQKCVRGKILGGALVESSDVVATALEKMTQSHMHTVEQLNTQIAGLQQELLEAVSVIETLSGQIANDANTTSSFFSPSLARPSFVVGLCSSSREKGGETSQEYIETKEGRPPVESQQQQKQQLRPSCMGEVTSEAFATAHSGSCRTGETLLEGSDVAHSALFAEVLQGRGTLKLQQQQQMSMVTQFKELTALLTKVVKENAAYRQELQLMRATSVPMEEHLQLMSERDKLEQECNFMKVEMRRLEDELGAALSAVPSDKLQGASTLALSLLQEEAPELLNASLLPPAPSSSSSSSSSSLSLSQEALKDATHDSSTREGILYSAHSQIADNSNVALGWNEDELQHNGLWKTAIRELEQQATLAATQLSAAGRLREAEDHIEELNKLNMELRRSLENLEAEDKCVREDCENLTFRNAVLSQQVASLLVRVERQRRALEQQGRQQQQEPLADEGDLASDSEILLAGEEPFGQTGRCAQRGRVALAAQSLLERRRNVSALAPPSGTRGTSSLGGPLDVALQPVGTLEVEGGVRTGLNVFAQTSHRPRRSLTLRNMGSPPVETDITRAPQLPATDQLSGVALGRLSCFTTIDAARITAQGDDNGYGKQRSNIGSGNEGSNSGGSGSASGSKSSGSFTKTLIFSDNTDENRHFLEILREDENLDRYSINSMAGLLQRNQELLKQLYAATQRANAAEERVKLMEKDGSCVTSDTEAAQPRHKVNRKRRREEVAYELHSHQEEGEWEVNTEERSPRHAALNSESLSSKFSSQEKPPHYHYCQHKRQQEEEGEEEEEGENNRQLLRTAMDDGYIQLEEHVNGHIDAILQKHEAQMTLTDRSLALSLLRIIELGRRPDDDGNGGSCSSSGNKDYETATAIAMKDAVITSLVRLCTEQGVRVANQAVQLASALKSRHAEIIQKCWDEAQLVLQRSTADLQAAVSSFSGATHHADLNLTAKTDVDVVSKGDANDGEEHDETQLLHSIASLLRTASLKDHTIQRLLQLAARQQRVVRRIGAERQQKGKEGVEAEVEVEMEDNDNDNDALDDDLDDDKYVLQRLRAQLDGMQVQYDKLLAAHHEERKQHTILLDRMWQLEEEKLSAVRSRDEALEHMATMMTREEYEATVDALDTAKASVGDLEAQLRYAQETNGQQLEELDRWRLAAVEHERQRAEDATAAATQIATKDRLIAQHVQQNYNLERRNAEQQASISLLETDVARHRSELEVKDEDAQALRKQLRRVELALLEQQCTQDLLFAIFPDDRALMENRHLIQVMRGEKERLAERVAMLQFDLDEAHRQLSAARLQIHGAEQARQEAELRLQEAVLARTTGTSFNILSSSAATDTTTTTKEAEIIELEMLRRTNASLLLEKREWLEREALLREQLEALGRDPVSENARRYGLKATKNFEEQLAEMQKRCVELQEQVAASEELRNTLKRLTDDKERLIIQLTAVKDDLVAQQEANEALRAKMKDMERALQEKAESHDAVKLTLAEKEELINSITGAISTLEEEGEKMDQRLRESDEEKQRLYQDNLKLIDTVSALTEEVKKKEAERRAAQTALAQGLASAASASHRWRGRSAGGSGGGPTSITGSLSKTSK